MFILHILLGSLDDNPNVLYSIECRVEEFVSKVQCLTGAPMNQFTHCHDMHNKLTRTDISAPVAFFEVTPQAYNQLYLPLVDTRHMRTIG